MSDDAEIERRRRNLEAVARHLVHGAAPEGKTAASDGGAVPPPPAAATAPPPTALARAWARWGSLGLLLAFVLGKLKLLLPLLKLVKLSTLLTMVLSIGAYAMAWGVPYAVGFVLLILVHELGHAWAMRREGIPAGAPVFIPFVGAVIAMRGLPRDAWVEAKVAIAGPLAGSAGAIVCLAVGLATKEPFWVALAWSGFFLNLFNLLPVPPLDGGRVVPVLSRWMWAAGYVLGVAAWLATKNALLLVVLLLGLLEVWRSLRRTDTAYFAVAPARRAGMGLAFFGLAAALAAASVATERLLAAWGAPAP